MPTINLGRVKAPPFIPLGVWNIATAYVVNDLVVAPGGDTFAAIADNTGENPDDALGSWQLFAAGGASGSDATVNATNVASVIAGAAAKTTPVDADEMAITDSASGGALKRLTFANLWAWIKGFSDLRYPVKEVKTTGTDISSTSGTATDVTGMTGITFEANALYRLVLYGICSTSSGGSLEFFLTLSGTLVADVGSAMAGSGIQRVAGTVGGGYAYSNDNVGILYATANLTNAPVFGEYFLRTNGSAGTGKIRFSQRPSAVSGTTIVKAGATLIVEKL